jgi:hypothetical protein
MTDIGEEEGSRGKHTKSRLNSLIWNLSCLMTGQAFRDTEFHRTHQIRHFKDHCDANGEQWKLRRACSHFDFFCGTVVTGKACSVCAVMESDSRNSIPYKNGRPNLQAMSRAQSLRKSLLASVPRCSRIPTCQT